MLNGYDADDKSLTIYNNKIDIYDDKIPEDLCDLIIVSNRNLKEFKSEIPKSIEKIEINKNKKINLNFELKSYMNLTVLRIEGNRLSHFDIELPPNLLVLYLDDNKLKTFTSILPPKLQGLSLEQNHLTAFKHTLPSSLTSLSLTDNLLRIFDCDLKNVKTCYLNENYLNKFNCNVKNVETLNLIHNNFKKITLNKITKYFSYWQNWYVKNNKTYNKEIFYLNTHR